MQQFILYRKVDFTGLSGTGIVADGVIFNNNKVAMCWRGSLSSIVIHDSIENVEKLHGHGGHTEIVYFVDEPCKLCYERFEGLIDPHNNYFCCNCHNID